MVHFRGRLNSEHSFISGTYGSTPSGKDGQFNLRSSDYFEQQEQDDKTYEWDVAYQEALLKHK
jgi:hypothetical protein